MNYSEAVKIVEKHQYLIGEIIEDNKEISHLVIVPSNRKYDSQIINAIYWDKDYTHMISQFTDFIVIVVFDLDSYAQTGVIIIDSLENVIAKYPGNI